MVVAVVWSQLYEDGNPLWSDSLCLYSYIHPTHDVVLYVGKAGFSTVRRRLHGAHKAQLFDDIHREYRVKQIRVLHGDLVLEEGRRRSSQLLADVESLLIMGLQPFGNIQSRKSRIPRPGLFVDCIGDWPLKQSRFYDAG